MKFQNQQDYSMVIEVKMCLFMGIGKLTGNGHEKSSGGNKNVRVLEKSQNEHMINM